MMNIRVYTNFGCLGCEFY